MNERDSTGVFMLAFLPLEKSYPRISSLLRVAGARCLHIHM